MKVIDVMLACNDHRNGTFLGTLSALEISEVLKVEGFDGQVPMAFVDERWLKIDGFMFPYSEHRKWVGNWCWDSVKMPIGEIPRLLQILRRNKWDCTEGVLIEDCSISVLELFDKGEISAETLEKALPAEQVALLNGSTPPCPVVQPEPIPADLIHSFEQRFNDLKLESVIPLQVVWSLKNFYLANIAAAYNFGMSDGLRRIDR